jgi:hypothetical protein
MKKWLKWICALIAVGLLSGVGYQRWFRKTNITIDETVYKRDVVYLDLSGKPINEMEKLQELKSLKQLDLRNTGLTGQMYDALAASLPGCEILWSVPFRASYFDQNAEELTVENLTSEELEELAYFPKLSQITLTGTVDADVIRILKETRPEIALSYTVVLNGKRYSESTAEICVENADVQEMDRALALLFDLESVTFTGDAPNNEQIYAWMCSYPQVRFSWDFELFGLPVNSRDTELILSGIPMESVEALEEMLKYLPELQWVEMCDCGISSAEMDALGKRHPQIRFVWTVEVGKCVLRTDVTTFMPYKFGYRDGEVLEDKDTEELKYCTDIICMDVGHMYLKDYSFLESMTKMQYLVLADTHGSDFSVLSNLKELIYLEIFVTDFEDARVLTELTKLDDLNISCTKIDDIEPLKEMKWLKRLWMIGCKGVDDEEKQELQDALADTQVVFYGKDSTGAYWRQGEHYYEMRDLLGMHYMIY